MSATQASPRVRPADASEGTSATHHEVVVVGAGFAGLGVAIRCKQAGIDDLVVLERADDVGGTWRDNTYPGCACDVPSHLYSFSFAPNPDWSSSFSPQPEILDYLRSVADEFDLRRHLRFGHEVLEAAWDEQARRWRVRTSAGELTASVLLAAAGPLSEPSVPDIDGLEGFPGHWFHSGRWDHDHDLTGRRVAVVGTGASGVQFVPEIVDDVGHLTVFQRTPPWVVPRRDRRVTRLERRLFRRVPALQRLVRGLLYVARELLVIPLARRPQLMRGPERAAQRHLRAQVPDPRLRARLTPDYRMGCKRILLSDDWYPTLTRDDVTVAGGVREIRGSTLVADDGSEHEVDTVIFGTGFDVTAPPIARRLVGADGRRLSDHWAEGGMAAYLGTAVAGFPNLFLLVGPNTGLGHTSLIYMMESQFAYIVDALRAMRAHRLGSVELRPATQRAHTRHVQRAMQGSVWTRGGCASWYLDEHGNNTTLWPDFTFRFRRRTRRFDLHRYVARPPVDGRRVAAPDGDRRVADVR